MILLISIHIFLTTGQLRTYGRMRCTMSVTTSPCFCGLTSEGGNAIMLEKQTHNYSRRGNHFAVPAAISANNTVRDNGKLISIDLFGNYHCFRS